MCGVRVLCKDPWVFLSISYKHTAVALATLETFEFHLLTCSLRPCSLNAYPHIEARAQTGVLVSCQIKIRRYSFYYFPIHFLCAAAAATHSFAGRTLDSWVKLVILCWYFIYTYARTRSLASNKNKQSCVKLIIRFIVHMRVTRLYGVIIFVAVAFDASLFALSLKLKQCLLSWHRLCVMRVCVWTNQFRRNGNTTKKHENSFNLFFIIKKKMPTQSVSKRNGRTN